MTNLKRIRKTNGLTQKQLADALQCEVRDLLTT